jgi:hypothetical protein
MLRGIGQDLAGVLLPGLALAYCGIVACSVSPHANAAASHYAAQTASYTEGDFGTATDRTLYSMTSEFGRLADRYDVSIAIPLHRFSIEEEGTSLSEAGIGDVTLRAGMRLWSDTRKQASFNGSLAVKFATGDEDRGLGTGATDVTGAVSASRRYGAWMITVLAGYLHAGEPSGVDYDPAILYGVGVNRRLTRASIFASVRGQTSVIPDGDAPLAFDLGFFRILSRNYVIVCNLSTGLSDGSPDVGVSAGMVRWFH